MRHPWTINRITFPSRAAVERHIREILGRYENYQQLNADDEAFMRSLLLRHPHYATVVGAGIAFFYVLYLPDGTRRFDIQRTDAENTRRDVGWRRCLVYQFDPLEEVTRIAREMVEPQIRFFRERRYESLEGWKCEICGELILNSKDAHADHTPPFTFAQIFNDWLAMQPESPDDIRIVASPHYQGRSRFADQALEKKWLDYHQDRAILRILCVPCHKTVTRKHNQEKRRNHEHPDD